MIRLQILENKGRVVTLSEKIAILVGLKFNSKKVGCRTKISKSKI